MQLSVGQGALLYNRCVAKAVLQRRDTLTLDDYMLTVFCLVDDQLMALHLDHIRQRGFAPGLSHSEVVTIELVGEFLGVDQDAKLFWYFRCHHADAFPGLCRIHRTTFLRQAANLCEV